METSSFPGSFGDNSTPKDMTYTHIVGNIIFDIFQHFGGNTGGGNIPPHYIITCIIILLKQFFFNIFYIYVLLVIYRKFSEGRLDANI